jgi:hypothetical protein
MRNGTHIPTKIAPALDIGADIHRGLANVYATCPFCGGNYVAGYLTDRAKREHGFHDDEPHAWIGHTQPHCDRFQANARAFLTAANKLARDRRQLT